MFGRRKVAALVSEFLATGVLTLVVLSMQYSAVRVPYFVAIGAGLVTAMIMYVFGSVSGAHTNPVVTLALWTARKVGTLTALLYVVVQLLGAWAAYGLYTYFVETSLPKVGGAYNTHVFVAEAIGTLVLGLGWGVIAYRNSLTVGNRAALLGLSYAIAILVASATRTNSLGFVNPAIALGSRAWGFIGTDGLVTYALGPLLGAVLGVNLYGLLFAPVSDVDSETLVVEEVIVAETTVATPTSTTRKRKTTTTAAKTRKAATTTRKTTTARAKKPAAKRTTRTTKK